MVVQTVKSSGLAMLEMIPPGAGINGRWPRCLGGAAIDRNNSFSVRHSRSTGCMV